MSFMKIFAHRGASGYAPENTLVAIKKAIELKNKEREAVLKFLELGRLNPSPVSGYELSTKLDALSFMPNMEDRIALIEKRTEEVLKDWEENYKGK